MADLTFDQIEGVYRRPAAARAKLFDRKVSPDPDNRPPAELPTRETFVAQMMVECGGDPAKWHADYDRLEKEWAAPLAAQAR